MDNSFYEEARRLIDLAIAKGWATKPQKMHTWQTNADDLKPKIDLSLNHILNSKEKDERKNQ